MFSEIAKRTRRQRWAHRLACAAALLLAAGLHSCRKAPPPAPKPAPKTKPAPPKTQPTSPAQTKPAFTTAWTSLFDGETLAGWKTPDWGGSGKVYVKDGAIHLEGGETCTGATYTGPIPREGYEIELEGMRVEGVDFFCALTFPVGKDPLSLVCGGWAGSVTGLSSLESYDASENETGQFIDYKNKRWYKIRVRVSKERIVVWVDDKEIIDLERKGRKIGIRVEMELSLPLGLATWQTHGAIRNLRMRLLKEGEG
jgi:hypothetical protein